MRLMEKYLLYRKNAIEIIVFLSYKESLRAKKVFLNKMGILGAFLAIKVPGDADHIPKMGER